MEGYRTHAVELYLRVRLACHVDGLSQREAASRFGIARETVKKMLRHSEAPGCRPPPATETPEAGSLHGDHRPYSGRRPNGSPQAASTRRSVYSSVFATNMASRVKGTIVKDYVRERFVRDRDALIAVSRPK